TIFPEPSETVSGRSHRPSDICGWSVFPDAGKSRYAAMAGDAFGTGNQLSVTFGTVSICMSLVLIVIDLFLKQRIGLGTFWDAFLVGIGSLFPKVSIGK
ncbi:MAG: hypothetical protein IJO13_06300, partial [Lachnospiraceae bacterium]|nr:hypothetical protein [Lachnospiraceae bacterium]